MLPTWKYFFSLLIVLASVSAAYSQEPPDQPPPPPPQQEEDAEPAQKAKPADTIKQKYLPSGLRVGTDVVSIIKSQSGDKFSGWEVNADLDFYRYFFTVDYGSWSRHEPLSNGDYANDGNYFRVGVDINFLLKDPDRNMFFIGFRYGHSGFNETVHYSYEDPVFGPISRSATTSGLTGHWAELTTGLRVKIWGGFWMGYTARMKFAPGVNGGGADFEPYDMPGYGLIARAPYWGFNYQLFWRFPLRKLK